MSNFLKKLLSKNKKLEKKKEAIIVAAAEYNASNGNHFLKLQLRDDGFGDPDRLPTVFKERYDKTSSKRRKINRKIEVEKENIRLKKRDVELKKQKSFIKKKGLWLF